MIDKRKRCLITGVTGLIGSHLISSLKPDWEIYKALADRLGFLDEYAEGNSEEDWIKKIFNYFIKLVS